MYNPYLPPRYNSWRELLAHVASGVHTHTEPQPCLPAYKFAGIASTCYPVEYIRQQAESERECAKGGAL